MPPSKRVKLNEAAKLYEDFSGHDAEYYDSFKIQWPDTGLVVGECDGILYTTVRDGVTERYIHKFKKHARPILGASYDGTKLMLIGGNFTFTERGIVDN